MGRKEYQLWGQTALDLSPSSSSRGSGILASSLPISEKNVQENLLAVMGKAECDNTVTCLAHGVHYVADVTKTE